MFSLKATLIYVPIPMLVQPLGRTNIYSLPFLLNYLLPHIGQTISPCAVLVLTMAGAVIIENGESDIKNKFRCN